MLIILYVKDLLIAGFSEHSGLPLNTEFFKQYEIESCGEARFCSNTKYTSDRQAHVLKISQTHYAENLHSRIRSETSKLILDFMESKLRIKLFKGSRFVATYSGNQSALWWTWWFAPNLIRYSQYAG